jgi:hypothetical protein
MEDSDRPPLAAEVCEEIAIRQYLIQKTYGPKLKLFSDGLEDASPIARVLAGNEAIRPPRRPIAFCKLLAAYAIELFDAEGRAYPRSDSLLMSLESLARRVEKKIIAHVLSFGNSPMMSAFRERLTYHLGEQQMREAIRAALKERTEPSDSHRALLEVPIDLKKTPEPVLPQKDSKTERGALRDSYLASFPEKIKILDICWAAQQRYREWKRWIASELKDGSTADRAFRSILTSGKRPEAHRKIPRPPKWQ